MRDILIKFEDLYIESELDGLKMDYIFSDEPKCHTVVTLKNTRSYKKLKRELNKMYESCANEAEGIAVVGDYLQSYDFHYDYCADVDPYIYYDLRDREEIEKYLDEATDKVWLMRSRKADNPSIEARRLGRAEFIIEKYPDIPFDREGYLNYTDWDCGYWNGIMGALRWVLGDDKNFLDT